MIKVTFAEWFEIILTHNFARYIPNEPTPPTTASASGAPALSAGTASNDSKQAPSAANLPLFVHPVCNQRVLEGNGTVALELLADDPLIDTILVPFGGGGLAVGVAACAKALSPAIKVLAVEVETAMPLTAALREGKPVTTPFTPSFVDGIGGPSVLKEMFPLAQKLIDG